MSNDQGDEISGKKNRKRLKRLYQQIRDQMEFYLSDANLQKDRFLMQQMNSSTDGYIDLSVFLRCNKILSMTSDIDVLTSAVATSKILVIDKEKKKVGRLVPYSEPKDVDERTVYVECLPTETDREWIRKVFGACGKIVYISLPRYKSTGDIKGFAFVEYETTESAQKACESINHPPAEAEKKVGWFPQNKQLIQLKRQVHFQKTAHGRKRRASESEMEKGTLPKAKRKRTMSEGEGDEVPALLTAPSAKQEPPSDRSKCKKHSSSVADEGKAEPKEAPSVKVELQAAKSKRIRISEGADAGTSLESKSETPIKVAEMTAKSKKAKKESKAAKLQGEKSEVKPSAKRARTESTEDVACVETKPEPTKKAKRKEENPEAVIESKTKALKRKTEGDESGEKKTKKVKICDERMPLEVKEEPIGIEVNGAVGDKTKKKKRQKKNKKTKTKEVPELRVIPKKQWLTLRTEYLKLQKANMNQLKKKLKDIRSDDQSHEKTKPAVSVVPSFTTSDEKEMDSKKKSEPEFVEGVIVKVTTDQPVTRKDLKERIWALGSIAYIDLKDRDPVGHIRCHDRETAVAISQASLPGYAFQRLSGADEQAYWQKLIDDRNKKLTTKTRTKQRGRDKILQKADAAYEKVKKPLHIIFD